MARVCYGLWATDAANGATTSAVLRQHMVLQPVRYNCSMWCYNQYRTNAAYGATACAVLTQRMTLQAVRY
eukprot:117104-Rhodomonas_salina.4